MASKTKICRICKTPFAAQRKDAKTCSPACRKKLQRTLLRQANEKVERLESALGRHLHELANELLKRHVVHIPLSPLNQSGSIAAPEIEVAEKTGEPVNVRIGTAPQTVQPDPQPAQATPMADPEPVIASSPEPELAVATPPPEPDTSLEEASQPLTAQPTVTQPAATGVPVAAPPADNAMPASDELSQAPSASSLFEQPDEAYPAEAPQAAKRRGVSLLRFNKTALAFTGLLVAIVALAGFGGFFLIGNKTKQAGSQNGDFAASSLRLDGIKTNPQLKLGDADSLAINGQLKLNGTLDLVPRDRPQAPATGELYLDKNDNQLYMWDGTRFVNLSPQANVVSFQGQSGDINLTAGPGIGIDGLTISNTGVTSLAGTANQVSVSSSTGGITLSLPQDIGTGSTPTFAGVKLKTISPQSGVTYGFASAAAGTYDICTTAGNCNGSVTTSGGTANTIAMFDSATNLVNSILTQDSGATTVSIGGNLSVSGTLSGNGSGLTNLNASNIASGTLSDARLSANVALLNASQTFTGLNTFRTPNSTSAFRIQDASGSTTFLNIDSANGRVGIGTNGPGYALDVQSGDVNTTGIYRVNGTPLSSANLSDQSNIALLNRDNQTFTGNAQVFRNNTDSLAAFVVQNTAASAVLTVDTTNGKVIGSLFEGSGANLTNLNASSVTSGTLAVNHGGTGQTTYSDGQLLIGNSSSGGLDKATLTAGAGISIVNGNGSITISAPTAGTCTNCATTALDNLASVAINTSLLTGSATIDLGSSANPFRDLYLGGTATNNFHFTGVASAPQTITVPDLSGTLCLSTGNCAGSGNGVTTSGGTANTIAMFDSAQNIVNSIITQDAGATTVMVGGDLNVSGGATAASFSGNGSGLTNLNASNIASGTLNDARLSTNVALLNANQTFSGYNIFKNTANSTTTLQVQNALGGIVLDVDTTDGGRVGIGTTGPGYKLDVQGGDINTTGVYRVGGAQISSTNLSNDSDLAKLSGSQTFAGANVFQQAVTIQAANSLTLGTAGPAGNLGGIVFHDGASANTGTLQLAGTLSGNATFKLPVTTGTQTICTAESGNCAGSGAGVTTPGGTTNQLAKFTGSQTLGDSSISDDGSTVTVSVGQVIQGSAGLTLGVSGGSGATGKLSFKNTSNGNTLTLQSGVTTSDLTLTLPTGDGSNGDCLKTNGVGTLVFAACTGGPGGGVTSINGLSGTLNLVGTANQVNVSSAGDTITLSLPQDINTSGNANFRTITLTGQDPADNLITGNAVAGQTGWLENLRVNGNSKFLVDASGNVNIAGIYQINGSQISSSDLSDGSNLAKLNGTGPQIFTGNNKFTGTLLIQPSTNSTTEFQIQNAAGSNVVLNADTTNGRIGIGTAAPSYPLDVVGDVNTTGVYRINGTTVCAASGCTPSSGSGFYIQNNTGLQLSANFNIQAANSSTNGTIGGIIRGAAAGQTVDLFQLQDTGGTVLSHFDASGGLIIGSAAASSGGLLTIGTNTNTASGGAYFGTDTSLFRSAGGTLTLQGQGSVATSLVVKAGSSQSSTDLFQLLNNSGTILSKFDNAGNLLVGGNTSSSTAFRVQNSSGANLVQVDTANNNILLGGNNSGEIQNWSTDSNSLPAARLNAMSWVANGYIYVAGGGTTTSSSSSNAVYYSRINADGSLAAWSTATNNLNTAVAAAGAASTNNYAYLVGGTTTVGGTRIATVQYARLNADGSTGSWTTTSSLPGNTPLANEGVTIANGYIYAVGGTTSGGTLVTTVYYAKINADGTLSSWNTDANSLPATSGNGSYSFAANGYLYEINGAGAIYYARLNSDGSTAAWSTNANSLPASKNQSTVYVANGYAYVVGGGGSSPTTTVYGKLNADGSIGAFTTAATTLSSNSSRASGVVVNGYLYVLGGTSDGVNAVTTVQHSSTQRIKVGGSLDLVGLAAGTFDAGAAFGQGSVGGTLTAGNTNVVGTLQVQGAAQFSQGLAITGTLSVNGWASFQNGTDSTTAFQIQNSAGTSNLLVADTTNTKIGLGQAPTAGGTTLQVTGGITATTGNINAMAGTLQTNSTTRVDNSGNLTNIGNFTATAGSTFATTGANGFTFKPGSNLTTAFQVQNATGGTTLLDVDTTNSRVGVLTASPAFALDVNGDINTTGVYRINGTTVCSGTSCTPAAGSGNYIQNGTSIQSANFAIQNNGLTTNVTAVIKQSAGQTGDLLQFQNSSGTILTAFQADGKLVFGPSGSQDTNLYRSNSGELTTNGDLVLQGGDLTTNQATATLFNTTATTVSVGGAATTLNIGPTGSGASSILLSGGSADTGCTINGATGNLTCSGTISSGSGQAFVQNGNSFGATAVLGTNDSNSLTFETNNTTQATIAVGGATTFKNSADSTTAFQIQNSSVATLLQVDTSNNNINVLGNNSSELQTWQTSGNSLPAARLQNMSVVANGYIYVIGGGTTTSSAASSAIYYAKLNADGTIGSWTTQSSNLLNTAVGQAGIAYANGYIYITGGRTIIGNTGSIVSTVQYAKLNADGSTGAWQTTTSLPVVLSSHSTRVTNGYIYAAGGTTAGGTRVSTVYYAKLNADGTVGAWQTNSFDIGCTTAGCGSPTPLAGPAGVTVNGYYYILGGTTTGGTSIQDVYYAKLNTDGSVGVTGTGWTKLTAALPAGRTLASAAALNGYIYLIGSGGTAGSVYAAHLNNDGSLGAFSTNTNLMASSVTLASFVSANGYLYINGGTADGTNAVTTVQYASTTRLKVGAPLDLVGYSNGNLSDPTSGGELTAGNTRIVGTLYVQGAAQFAQGLGITGNLTVSGSSFVAADSASTVASVVRGATSQTADLFQLQDSTGANLQRVDANGNLETIGYYNNGIGGIGQFGNLLTYSEQLDNAAWTATNVTVTANDSASNPAPDGQTSAEKLVSSASGTHSLTQTCTTGCTTNSATYTYSVYVKTNSSTQPIQLRIDWNNGSGQTGTAASYTATTTWQRFTVTQTVSASGMVSVTPTLLITNNSATVVGWGAQLIQQAASTGTSPQVYVRSTAAQVSASAGVVSNGGLFISAINATDKPLIVQGAPSQSGDLLQIQNSSGNKITGFDSAGKLQFADGAGGAYDTNLYRSTASTLKTDGDLTVGPITSVAAGGGGSIGVYLQATGRINFAKTAATNTVLASSLTTDTTDRFVISASGKQFWGPGGSTALDTTLARNSAGELLIQGTGGATGTLLTVKEVASQSSDLLQLQNSSGTVLSHFDSAGSLALGSASAPSYKLDVTGTGHFTGAVLMDSTLQASAVGAGVVPGAYALQVQSTTGSGQFAARIYNSNATGNGLIVDVASDTQAQIYLQNAAQTSMRHAFYGSGTAKLAVGAGNVVIGVDSIGSYKLDVTGTGRFTGQLTTDSGISSTGAITVTGVSNGLTVTQGNNNPSYATFTNIGGNSALVGMESNVAGTTYTNSLGYSAFLGSTTARSVQLFTNNSARLTVDSTGQVGIGTTGPGATLDVNGTARLLAGNAFTLQNAAADANVSLANTGATGVSALRILAGNGVGFNTSTMTGNGINLNASTTSTGQSSIYFGTDTNLYRSGSARLVTDGGLDVAGANLRLTGGGYLEQTTASAGSTFLRSFATSDTFPRLQVLNTGQINLGSGSATGDTALSRASAGTLQLQGINAATGTQLVLKEVASQSTDLLQLQNSSGTVLSHFDSSGQLALGTASAPGEVLELGSGNIQLSTTGGSNGQLRFGTSDTYYIGANGNDLEVRVPNNLIKFLRGSNGAEKLRLAAGGSFNPGLCADGAGTVCLVFQSSGRIGIGHAADSNTTAAQLDIRVQNAAFVGQTIMGAASQSADLLQLQNSSSGVLSKFDSSGNLLVGGITSSTTAFRVQNASAATLFQVDSSNNNITIGGNNSSELQTWQSANTLPATLYGTVTVSSNGYIYVIGGYTGSAYSSNTYYAKLNADGSTGSWSTGSSLPAGRYYASGVIANGYVYVFGGENSTATNTVYYAKLNADGSIGTWNTNGTTLPKVFRNSSSVTANGYVYVIGGEYNGDNSNVYYAKPNSDGSISAWTIGTSLTAGRTGHASVVANGYVYVIGGSATTGASANVYYAPLNADGSIGSWTDSTNQLPGNRYGASAAIANGYLYVIGGSTSAAGSGANTVYAAALGPSGAPGVFSTNTNTLPANRQAAGAVTANGYIYLTGGYSGSANNTVYYASTPRLKVGGSLDLVSLSAGTWTAGGSQGQGSVGGSLTAGDTNIVGTLQVQGQANFAQNASIAGNLVVGNVGSFASILTTTPSITNYVTNPSFETNTTGWVTDGSSVITTNWLGAAATLTRDTGTSAFGSASMKIAETAGQYAGAYSQLTGTFTAGQTYTLSFYMKGNAGGESQEALIGTGSDNSQGSVGTITTSWQRYTRSWTPATNQTNPYVAFRAGPGAPSTTVFVDGVQVAAGSSAQPYADGSSLGYFWGGTSNSAVTYQKALEAQSQVKVTSPTAASVAMIIQAAASQTGDLLQVQNSSGTALSRFDSSGNLAVGTTTGLGNTTGAYINSAGTIALTRSAGAGNPIIQGGITSDNQPQFRVDANGDIYWGAGASSAVDTKLYRGVANGLRTDDQLQLSNSSTTCTAYATGGAESCVWFGSDTNLYRAAAGILKTDGKLLVGSAAGTGGGNTFLVQDTINSSSYLGSIVNSSTNSAASGLSIRVDQNSATNVLLNVQTGSSGTKFQVLGDGSTNVTGNFKTTAGAAGTVAATIKAAASQSADLLQLQNSSGTVLSHFDSGGKLAIGTSSAPSGDLHVAQIANGDDVIFAKRNTDTSPTGNFLRLQNAAGSDLVTIDISGNLTVKSATFNGNITVNGHVITGNTSGSTTATVNTAGAGTGASCSVTGNDTSGQISITFGAGGAAGSAACTINFSANYGSAPKPVFTMATYNATNNPLPFVQASAVGSFAIGFTSTPPTTGTYLINYFNAQ